MLKSTCSAVISTALFITPLQAVDSIQAFDSIDSVDFHASRTMHMHKMHLSDQEREKIWQELNLCTMKMRRLLEKADYHASRITDINVREFTKGAIQGAICGVSGKTMFSVVIGGCLGALAYIGGEAFDHFCDAQDLVREAEFYAREADRLQERLWRDQ